MRFGMCAMTEDAAQRIFSIPDLSNGRDILLELIAIAEMNRLRMHEVSFVGQNACSCGGGAWNWMKFFLRSFRARSRMKKSMRFHIGRDSGAREEDEV